MTLCSQMSVPTLPAGLSESGFGCCADCRVRRSVPQHRGSDPLPDISVKQMLLPSLSALRTHESESFS